MKRLLFIPVFLIVSAIFGIAIFHQRNMNAAAPVPPGPSAAPPPAVTITVTAPNAAAAQPPIALTSAIIERDGDTLRLLNTLVRVPDTNEMRHVDLILKLNVDRQGKVVVESAETRPTSLLGVNALIPGTYTDGKQEYEIKGPAIDVDMRPTWSITGRAFYGNVIAGPIAGHPQLSSIKGTESLPEAGVYGAVFHDRAFPGFINNPKTVVSLRQVDDTIVVTGYAMGDKHLEQTGVVVLQRKKQPIASESNSH